MQITIILETGEDTLGEGFGLATGWPNDGTSTIEEWIAQTSAQWIYNTAIQGKIQDGTTVERAAYTAKVKIVRDAAITSIPKPPIIKPPRTGFP